MDSVNHSHLVLLNYVSGYLATGFAVSRQDWDLLSMIYSALLMAE